jgi:6-phosphogluconolactonase
MRRFSTADALAHALAQEVATALARACEARGGATLVVSGGHSPRRFFEALSAQVLEWRRVTVTLADERWVAPTDAASNERLVREGLLRGHAAAARFVALKNTAASAQLGAAAAWQALESLPRPFDLTILGMGDDGHTASLIPGSAGLKDALDSRAAPGCVAMVSPVPPHERLSLNLSALLDSRQIAVLLFGDVKLVAYARAEEAGPIEAMPIRAVLRQERVPVDVVWAPT